MRRTIYGGIAALALTLPAHAQVPACGEYIQEMSNPAHMYYPFPAIRWTTKYIAVHYPQVKPGSLVDVNITGYMNNICINPYNSYLPLDRVVRAAAAMAQVQ